MKTKLFAVIGMLLGLSAWGQSTLLYTGTFTSPYDSGTKVTLQLWGNPGDKAQEHVNYIFQGPSASEVNTVRIDFASTLKATWSIDAVPTPTTIQQAYAKVTGTTVVSLPTTPMNYAAALAMSGGSSQSLTSGTTAQNGSWDMDAPWLLAASGVWWATFTDATNLAPMFTYDAGLSAPKLVSPSGMYLAGKTVQLELVKNNPLNVHIDQPTLSGSTLQTTLTSVAGPSAGQPSWQTLNLWVNGVLQSPTALTKGTASVANGVRRDHLNWSYAAGNTYQLQAVDALGNSQSVWYPQQSYRLSSLGKVIQIAAGPMDTVALKSDGTVWAWGRNSNGQLGNNSTTDSHVPVEVSGLTGVVSIAAGGSQTMALKSDGTVWAWGYNYYGQLGNNSITQSHVPVEVSGLTGVVSIAAGLTHSVALKSDGTVWAWGRNYAGELGNNSTTDSHVPVQVIGLTGVSSIAAGDNHTVVLKSDGTVWGCGLNGSGQLGNNLTTSYSVVPVQTLGLARQSGIAAGDAHSVALKSDGTVWAWGANYNGLLGNNSTVQSLMPLQVIGLTGVTTISAGGSHTVVLKSDGTMWAWGYNLVGQLGNNSTISSLVPIQVSGLTGVAAIAAGNSHTVALKTDGTVWAWGLNSNGQLGNRSTTDSHVPVPVTATVSGLTMATAIAAGNSHTVALKTDGTVWAWGLNSNGQLGNNSTTDSHFPVPVNGLTGVTTISAGGSHTVALKSDGTVWAWGLNSNGQLGNNSTTDSRVPVQVSGLTGVTAIAAGNAYTLALKSDGTVWAWGLNSNGQLGNSSTTDSHIPVQVSSLTGVTAIAAGVLHIMALKSDGTVWAWGYNYYGQLGNGRTSNSLVPVRVSFPSLQYGDTTPPIFLITGPSSIADQTWTASGVTLVDDMSGVSASGCGYVIDGNPLWSGTFTVIGDTITIGTSTVPSGSHTVVLTAADNAGNKTPLTFAFVIDRTGPAITATAPNYAKDSWTATNVSITDPVSGVNPASYQYAFDGGMAVPFTVSNGTVTLNTSGLSEGVHTVVLSAANNAGYSSTASYSFTVDRTGPVIAATVPQAVNAASLTVTGVSLVDAGSGTDAVSAQWWLDSAAPPTSPNVFTASSGTAVLVLEAVADGAHTLYLSVADKLGNQTTAVYPFTVDTIPPVLTATVPPFTDAALSFPVSLTDAGSGPNAAGLVWWLDSASPAALAVSSGQATIALTGFSEGSHTLYLRGQDVAGNTTTVSYPFTLDLTPPSVVATAAPYANANLALTGVSFTDALSGPAGSLVYWFDTAAAPSTPGTLTVSGGSASVATADLAAGGHVLYLRGADVAGNTATVPYSFSVNRTAPSLAATFAPFVNASGTLSGTVSVSDTTGIASVSYAFDGSFAGTLPASGGSVSLSVSASLTEGSHTLVLTVTDNAGNSAAGGPYTFTIDRTPPVLSAQIGAWANASLSGTGLRLTDSGSGPASVTSYWFDGASSTAQPLTAGADGSFAVAVSSLAEGAHTLSLKASDLAGNTVVVALPFTISRLNPSLIDAGLTENGTAVQAADYLQGGTDLVLPQYADPAPVQFRLAANQAGKAPQTDDWLAGAHADWTSSPVNVSTWFPGSVPSYLYVQARDAAGNLSAVTERVIRVDSGAPGTTNIRSTTFPFAQSPRDAVAQTVGIFQFSVSSTGPGGLKNYEWAFYQAAAQPVPGTDLALQSGTAATGVTLNGLADTQTGQYYWLAARAVGGNGKPGAWSFYPFAVNTTPPQYLTVTSSTHPLPSVAYQGLQASFQWNQPADFNGVKSYYYRYSVLPVGTAWTPPTTLDGAWTSTSQPSLVVRGLAGSGEVAVAVAAQDWSGNTAFASFVATFDNTAPVWNAQDGHTLSVVPDPENRKAVLTWRSATDDLSDASSGLVYGVELQDITSQPYTEVQHWQYLSALPFSMQTEFGGLVPGHAYLATVAVIDGAGNPLVVPLAFQETDPASQVLPAYDVGYSLNFGGLLVTGTTTYTGTTITAQSAVLELQGTPLSTPPVNPPVTQWPLPLLTPAGPGWLPAPSIAADPDAALTWSSSSAAGPVHGVTFNADGLSLGTLTLTLSLSDAHGRFGADVSFGHVSIGPAPDFAFVSSDRATLPDGVTMAADGWNLSALQGASLQGKAWTADTAQAQPSDGRFTVSSDAAGQQPVPLVLTGSQISGLIVEQASVTVPADGLYVTARGLTIRVVHAAVEGSRLLIAQGYALVSGLGPTDLELEDVFIDEHGMYVAGPAYASHLAGAIATPYGTLTAGQNAFVIENGDLVLSLATLTRADGSSVVLQDAVFDSTGLTSQGGTVSGSFEGVYFGFPVHASGGSVVGGVRIFSNATIDLPAFGVSGVALPGLGVSLADDSLRIPGVSSGSLLLLTAYGSGIVASSLNLAPTGVSALLTVVLPSSWGGGALSLGIRTLASSGAVGAGTGSYPSVTYKGFSFQPVAASITSRGLSLDLAMAPYTPISGSVSFSGLTLVSDGTIVQPGTAPAAVDHVHYQNALGQTVDWNLNFPSLRVDALGVDGEPVIALPSALGGSDYQLGTTILQTDGSVVTQPSSTAVQMTVFGWTTSAASLSLDGPNFVLGGATVLIPGLMQGNDIPVGSVQVDQQGTLVSTDQAQPTVFRGTNGFEVAATNVRFDPRGLVMGGQVLLPVALGGASITFPDGSLFLEPDGALVGEADAAVAMQFAGFPLTATKATLDRTGLTVSGGSVTPLGLAAIPLPDFTVYSTGELAVAGQSLDSGSFTIPGGVTVAYSGVRFSDAGLSLSAEVSLPASWGGYPLAFDDITISPDGHISSSASLQNLVLGLDTLGMTATIGTLRLADDGFHIDNVQLQFSQGDLASQPLSVGSARIGFDGVLDLYGFSFAPIDLYGYKVTLSGLSVGPSGIGLSGGITLSNSIPIPELQGLYLPIKKFDVGFDGSVRDFEVSIDQGFSMTVFDSWTVGIQGFTISKNLLQVNQATLDLPASFNLPQLVVSGLTIDLASSQITWGQIAVQGVSYQWNGLSFNLTSLQIDPQNGLIFGGTVDIPATSPNGTPYPALLQNRTLVVDSLQILPSGLPGTVSATLTGINGPLFDDNILLSNAGIILSNQGGNLIFGFTGGLKLGAAFPAGLAGLTLNIQALSVNVSDGAFGALAAQVTAADGLGPLTMSGGMAFVPQSIALAQTSGTGFEVDASGVFQTNATFPGSLANVTVPIQAFRMDSSGHLLELKASTALPDAPINAGLSVSGASLAVTYPGLDGGMDFSLSGSLLLGSGFLDGLSGLALNVRSLVWSGAGSLVSLDARTSWSGPRAVFGAASINDGSVTLSGSGTAPWSIGVSGVFQLPDTLPQGLAGLTITIGSLVFETNGSIRQADIATSPLNLTLFGTAALNNASLRFSKYDAHALRIDVDGATLTLPAVLGPGLGSQSATLNHFAMTTAGAVLALDGTVPLAHSIPLFAGLAITQSQLGFSNQGVSVSGTLVMPSSLLEGVPTFAVQRAVFAWDGRLTDLAAGLGHAVVKLGGFTTDITNLTVSTTGVAIQAAVLTLPPDMGSRQISLVNAGFTTGGQFTGTVGVSEIDQNIAGFVLQLNGMTLDVSSHVLRVVSARLQTPNIGTLSGFVQLNTVTIGPSGMALGGVGFSLPNFNYGGVGFRSVFVSFSVSGSAYLISGGGQASITGLGTLDAQLSFTNVSSTYPIGLQRAYFQYTMTPGIPLGTTGLYLNQIRGGFTYGPPNELPGTLKPLFDNSGPRLQLGVGLGTALGSGVLQMNANFWIDVHNAAWAFDGNATVLSGLTSGDLQAGYGNSIFYGSFSFAMVFVEGKVQIWIFPYHGSTVLSGEGGLEFLLRKGALFHKHISLGWFGSYNIDIPGGTISFGGISAQFGQFNRGVGVEGSIDVPCWGSVGVFVDGGGMHFNTSDYSLIKPAGY